MRENVKKKIQRKNKRKEKVKKNKKYILKVNKLFLFVTLNSFYLW